MQSLNSEEVTWLQLLPRRSSSDGSDPLATQRHSFEEDPKGYLESVLSTNAPRLPALVVGFASTMEQLTPVLAKQGYARLKSLRNCLIVLDDESVRSLELWELQSV